ncbi:MAG TPA: response regulator [Burkholderiales bacterium]|nr:response regulator [Burkholderiales bacterium]
MTAPPPIQVVLVDDHTLFRKGLAELLEHTPGLKVAGATGKAEEARSLVAQHTPDAVLLDLHLPPNNGIALLRELKQDGYTNPVLMLTVSDAEEDLATALQAGAKGYLLKDMEPDDVVDAIKRAARGETVVAPAMTLKLVKLLQGNEPASSSSLLDLLTGREKEILTHLARGESNKVIARALSISHDTVKLHVRHILAKLNLSSRVEAAVFAVEQKLVSSADRDPNRLKPGRAGG